MLSLRFPLGRQALVAVALYVSAALGACGPDRSLPESTSETYREAVSAFYAGLAAMEVGADEHAEASLLRVTRLVPREPAAWANLGLLALRRNEFDAAAERLETAEELAPQSSSIQILLGLLASNRGRLDEGMAYLRRAIELDSTNLRAMYGLAQEIERRAAEGWEAETERWLDRILSLDPDNIAVLVETSRIAARRGDAEDLQYAVSRIAALAPTWPIEAREQLDALQAAVSPSDFRDAATRLAFLRNVLLTVPVYRADLAAVQTPAQRVGEPIERFLRLPEPRATPAPPDDSMTFAIERLLPSDSADWAWAGAVSLSGEGPAALVVADGRRVRVVGGATLAFPGGPTARPPSAHGIVALDFDYDFRLDLAMAGAGGLRLFRQDEPGAFSDVTAQMALPDPVIRAPYTSVWAADLDLEGDIDILLGAAAGPPRALRNNGDGTFTELRLFEDIDGLRGFAWADLDGDGDPDAALVDGAGTLHVFGDERQARFIERPLPGELSEVTAIAAADAGGDGRIDLILLRADGTIQRLSDRADAAGWTLRELARSPDLRVEDAGSARLFVADLDNNGGLDLTASNSAIGRIWLQDTRGNYRAAAIPIEAQIFAIVSLGQDGRLDLVGLTRAGRPVAMANRGTRDYRWTRLRPRAAEYAGDQRINSFGIGGEVELRSGLLYQKQPITAPIVHFGLGENLVGDVARIIWPNGVAQAEFDLPAERSVRATQRLKGSCPWVFTYDGTGMRFVTDFIWRSPLGMRINAQETAGAMSTEDWVKIRGDQLVPRDGYYDVRVTAELWETHFFDHVSLMVVDHPEGTQISVDERFAIPPPPLAVQVTAVPRPVARAWDDRGRDVTETIRAHDERYLDTFGRGRYQGVTRDHYVEVELGEDAPRTGPLWLIASGWIRPTDSSINIAMSQGRHARPKGLRLEVPDGRGGWVTVAEELGFPAGKSKTVLISLADVFRPGTPRRVRLHTNLEVYWDRLAWAAGLPATEITTRRIAPATAELRFRGFSEVREADRSSPEYPTYERLAGTSPLWRDLIGYYTRFGDVRELLESTDDRYVIMNAGDELAFRFPAPPGPPEGWVRDFVLIGDGWVKDGDYNTVFSKTVRPLPSHDQPQLTTPPGRLADDPVYRRNPRDWRTYHTRYVTPENFRAALMPRSVER